MSSVRLKRKRQYCTMITSPVLFLRENKAKAQKQLRKLKYWLSDKTKLLKIIVKTLGQSCIQTYKHPAELKGRTVTPLLWCLQDTVLLLTTVIVIFQKLGHAYKNTHKIHVAKLKADTQIKAVTFWKTHHTKETLEARMGILSSLS